MHFQMIETCFTQKSKVKTNQNEMQQKHAAQCLSDTKYII